MTSTNFGEVAIMLTDEQREHLTALYGADFMANKDAQIRILIDEIVKLRSRGMLAALCDNVRDGPFYGPF